MDLGGAVRAVFRPVGAGEEHCSTLTTTFTFPTVEHSRLQFPVQRKDSGPKVFADQGAGDTLNADAGLPAVVQQQAVSIVIIAAFMHQPLDGAELLVVQMRYGIFQSIILS